MADNNPLTPGDLIPILTRVDLLEKTVSSHSGQYTEIRVEMGKLEEGMKGIREQAKSHNKTHNDGITQLKEQFDESLKKIESTISGTGRELQETLDKIINTLGIDEDPHAASGLRDNLKFLNGLRLSREETITWTKRGLIALIIAAFGSLIVAGATKIVGGH